ncbi:PaaI family thioesterase [Nocardia sp. NPDC051570]|uniref:PaaI family thioesterase n=1 Tax=Nocardia sp. NPDC051570 TaxID=3364324 RepID=UPI0037923D02
MSDDAIIQGHEQILAHTLPLFRDYPIPPEVELELPPPSTKTLDIRFEEYVPGRSLTATATAAAQYGNAVGTLQAGILSAMLDDVIGPLTFLTARGLTTCMEMTTHFLRPVRIGDRLRLSAMVRKAGRTVIFVAAEAHTGDDKLVATVMSTQQVVWPPAR